jgi:PAS domain S-box-containing protein
MSNLNRALLLGRGTTLTLSPEAARLLATALVVGVAYYVGVWIGFTTVFPDAGIARRHIFWPPNVILLAAFLVTPVRWWWPCSLTAFAAHLLAHAQLSLSPAVMALPVQFAGNLLQAVLAAFMLRRLNDPPWRVDTLHNMSAMIGVAGVAAPALVSALVIYVYVWAGWMPDFTSGWTVRFLANAVSTITLAPLLFPIAAQGLPGLRDVDPRRAAEFVAVLAGLLVVGALTSRSATSAVELPLLYAPLPLLLWAAVRFGSSGLSIALVVTLLLFVSQILGGPSVSPVPGDNTITLGVFLLAIAIPLLLLSAIVQEQRSKEQALGFSEARYRAVVEDQTELICRFLRDGTYTFVNDAYCRYFQRSREELLGRSFWIFIPPEGHRAAQEFLESITPERPIAAREHEVLAPDGETRWQQWRDRGFFDDQGRVVEYQAVGRDITERKRAEAQLDTQYTITRILSEAASMAEGTPRVLQTICKQLDCEYGEIWRIDRKTNVLICGETWHLPLAPLTEFESASRQFVFPFALGLPGRVWQTGKPVCIPDVTVDPDFLRGTAAANAGLRGALGFPILSGDDVLGVIVLFAREIREADKDRLEMMTSIGSQMGQFLERKSAEKRNEELLHNLGERVKELTALHKAARILQNEERTTAEWLQEIVAVLPPAWQYPEITAGRIRVGELESATPNFKETPWMQRAVFSVGEELLGTIEVAYLEERGVEEEGPFLAEERNLIDSLAEVLRSAIERRQVQEQVSLLQIIAMEVGAANDFSSALEVVLRRVCEKTGWIIGQAWIPRQDGTVLDCGPAWFSAGPDLEIFREQSEKTTFLPGMTLPGLVWSSKQPVWLQDVTLDTSFSRVQVARKVGLKAALGVPILSGDEVLAVIEFFMHELRCEDEQIVKLITTVAAELDLVIKRKRAEQTLRENQSALWASYARIQDLAGKLITAQEAERSRIAGELHDDVNQQLASLSIALSNIKQQLRNGSGTTVQDELSRLQERTIQLADVIRSLSHELHPGVLQHAGLVAALRGHCQEFGAQHAIEVTLSATDGLEAIPHDVALCLYRVVQEALRNIAEHAGATAARVALNSTENGLELVIADDGHGFNVAEAKGRGGLGLISLDERVRLIGGSLTINTEPERGTELRVQVPLGANR